MIPLSHPTGTTQPSLGYLHGINDAEPFHFFYYYYFLGLNNLLGKPQRWDVPTRAQTGKFSFSHLQKSRESFISRLMVLTTRGNGAAP